MLAGGLCSPGVCACWESVLAGSLCLQGVCACRGSVLAGCLCLHGVCACRESVIPQHRKVPGFSAYVLALLAEAHACTVHGRSAFLSCLQAATWRWLFPLHVHSLHTCACARALGSL